MGMDKAVLDPNAIKQGPLGHAGRGKDRIGPYHFMQGVFAVQIGNAKAGRAGALIGIAKHQTALELTTNAFQCGTGQNTFRLTWLLLLLLM